MNSPSSTDIDYRWQCRRGMLELDLLLNNFVEKKAAQLDERQRQTFELLLSYPDQTLFDLLLGEAISSDSMISNMIEDIRSTTF